MRDTLSISCARAVVSCCPISSPISCRAAPASTSGFVRLRRGGQAAGAGEVADEKEWRGAGIDCCYLDAAETSRREPALALGLLGAWYLPGLAQVRNPRLLKAALVAGCNVCGVRMTPCCPVQRFEVRGQRLRRRIEPTTANGFVAGNRFLIAAGAWSGGSFGTASVWQPGIRPIRGQIVLLNNAGSCRFAMS